MEHKKINGRERNIRKRIIRKTNRLRTKHTEKTSEQNKDLDFKRTSATIGAERFLIQCGRSFLSW